MNVFDRFKEAWLAFRGRDHPGSNAHPWGGSLYTGPTSYDRPDRLKMKPGNERTVINAAFNRIALDVASVEVHHAKVDENGTYQDVIKDELEELFTVEANIDQSAQSYMIDLVMSLFDEGDIAEVPVDWADDQEDPFAMMNGGQVHRQIRQIRTAKILEWKPMEIKVDCYNQQTGQREQVPVGKRECAIIHNPFYSVMNERNSVFQRLSRKLMVLDAVDQNYSSDKLNMIFQLPYIVRGETKRKEAANRMSELESQLQNSPHGIGWIDGTEKVIQLNRPLENNLQAQVEWLTEQFYSQLGITLEIMNGTADEKTMSNYMTRTVGVVLEAICSERRRKFLTKKQRDNGESVIYVQDPLKLVPVTNIADIFDKLTRNAILSPNESRGILGYKPSQDPGSDKLMNRNMPVDKALGGEAEEAQAEAGAPVQEPPPEIAHSQIRARRKPPLPPDRIPRVRLVK